MSFVLLTCNGHVWGAAAQCVMVLPQIESAFQDIHGQLSTDENTQLQLLRECETRNPLCVVVEDSHGTGYRLVEGKHWSEKTFVDSRKLVSVSAIGLLKNRNYQQVCVLARYSGGSAASWAIDAWYIKDGTAHAIDTDKVTIQGEGIAPAGLLQEMSKSIYRLR